MVLPTTTPTAPTTKPPTFAHEMVMVQFHSIFQNELQKIAPVFGTVVGQVGEVLTVQPDTERGSWRAEYLAGTYYDMGRRVLIAHSQGGVPVVLGVIPRSREEEAVISQSQIMPAAIGPEQIANGSITGTKIAPDAVTTYHIVDGCINLDKIVGKAIDGSWITAKTIPFGALTQEAQDKATAGSTGGGALKPGSVFNYHLTTDCVQGGNIAAKSIGTSDLQDGLITWIQLAQDVKNKINRGIKS